MGHIRHTAQDPASFPELCIFYKMRDTEDGPWHLKVQTWGGKHLSPFAMRQPTTPNLYTYSS